MRAALLICLLMVPSLAAAGCFSAAPTLEFGTPAAGQVFVYESDDGSSMVVTVLGKAIRTDALQEGHEAWILEYVWRTAARPDVPIPVHEAVAVSDGRHLRHDVLCEVKLDTWECYKTDEILFGPVGLAGGLGVAPLWGRRVAAGHLPAFGEEGLDMFEVTSKWTDHDGSRCLALAAGEAPSLDLRAWMPVTSHAGERIMCEGDILPRQWSPDQPVLASVRGGEEYPRFTLAKTERTSPPSNLANSRTSNPIPRMPSNGTTALLSSFVPPEGLDAMTAHGKAIELDGDYREFLERHDDAMVVRAEYAGDISSTGLLYNQDHAWWTLRLANQAGQTYELTVEQVVRNEKLGEQSTRYIVRDQVAGGDLGEGVPHRRSFTGIGADLVFAYGERLFGQPADGSWHAFRVPSQHRGVGYPVEDRFYSRTFYTPPDERDQFISHPWIVEADSLTGRLTYVRLPPEKMMDA